MTTQRAIATDLPERVVRWLRTGGWYFVVTVASVGLAAWVPSVHAALRLGRPRPVVRDAIVFGAAAAVLCVLFALTPAVPLLSSAGGFLAGAVVVAACVRQVPARQAVYLAEPAPEPVVAVTVEVTAQAKRDQARELVRRDPSRARELRVGRPDLDDAYDDGGLVDLASAPAPVIAKVCELDEAVAESIVDKRESFLGLHTVDDVFSLTDAPLTAWDRIRDRAVVISG